VCGDLTFKDQRH